MTRWIEGLAEIAAGAEGYDGFVIDQFGVLHDGSTPYPGAAEALAELRQRGRRVIVLSNSGKRAAPNGKRLARFGVTPQHYDALITSGELTHQMLRQRDRAPFDRLGRRVLLGHPEDDAPLIEGLGLQPVEDAAEAHFVLLASLPEDRSAEALLPRLAAATARRLPLLCANPDVHRLTPRGVEPSTGWLAERHAAAGAEVVWLGKPHALIYTVCREALGRMGSRHFLAIGDSLAHDIAGGLGAGYDTCFIGAGLHGQDFATCRSPAERYALLERLVAEAGAKAAAVPPTPQWAMHTLRWA